MTMIKHVPKTVTRGIPVKPGCIFLNNGQDSKATMADIIKNLRYASTPKTGIIAARNMTSPMPSISINGRFRIFEYASKDTPITKRTTRLHTMLINVSRHPSSINPSTTRPSPKADSHQEETVRLLASETIITVSGNMESNLNIASVLHRLLQVLVLIYLPNIKDPVLVKVNH